ncbi:Transcriptional regulator [Carbonactinospora thermoautotrophica]|uniref:Transcriptional regulator n=1 Tax=Carbonactinospora thermoautotrophica TaxID=1469144 RepID=A0A132MMG6_9ACTN|nr:GntR family transcriptional regulator [Carbonactinospora thermoautotrophica]KWW98983.1 Transcriptional regulator [Carbonactinospora thermoautotrophica]
MIDPTSDRPAYQQVADELRRRILSGEAPPGTRLPSESELMREFGISRTTARLTYNVLRAEGLIDTARGKGAFVRDRRSARRVASDRYRREVLQIRKQGEPTPPPETSFTRDQGISWSQYRLDKEFHEVPAPDHVAELLNLEPGTPVLARHFVFYAEDQPQQMSVSYYPLDLVRGTPVADPNNEPWPGGNIAQLATLGITVTRVEESVRARMPLPEEKRTLRIPPGVPVLTITRRMLAGPNKDRPVEVAADIVIPADRVVLDYTIDLD